MPSTPSVFALAPNQPSREVVPPIVHFSGISSNTDAAEGLSSVHTIANSA